MEGSPKEDVQILNYKLIKRKPLINLHSGLIKTYLWYKKFI